MAIFESASVSETMEMPPTYMAHMHLDGAPDIEIIEMNYRIVRPRAPVYSMGSIEPRSFSRGRRTVSGTFKISWRDWDNWKGRIAEGFSITAESARTNGFTSTVVLNDLQMCDYTDHGIGIPVDISFSASIEGKIPMKTEKKPHREMTNQELAALVLRK